MMMNQEHSLICTQIYTYTYPHICTHTRTHAHIYLQCSDLILQVSGDSLTDHSVLCCLWFVYAHNVPGLDLYRPKKLKQQFSGWQSCAELLCLGEEECGCCFLARFVSTSNWCVQHLSPVTIHLRKASPSVSKQPRNK